MKHRRVFCYAYGNRPGHGFLSIFCTTVFISKPLKPAAHRAPSTSLNAGDYKMKNFMLVATVPD